MDLSPFRFLRVGRLASIPPRSFCSLKGLTHRVAASLRLRYHRALFTRREFP